MLTIMGATGHTGGRIARALLQAGEPVRAIGRSASKLAELKRAAAETAAGEAADAGFLANAFRGSDAVYTLIPPDPRTADYRATQDALGEAIISAIQASGVRYVVFLSSLGGEVPAGTGPIAGLHAQEERLRQLSNVHALVLRPAYFFENFYETLGLIKEQGINGGAIAGDLVMPMISTKDIAEVAAEALRQRSWTGHAVRELLGERDLSHTEASRILGRLIDRPDLQYVQFPYADYTAALVRAGLSPSVANLYTELARALNDGTVTAREERRAGNTTPTRFEEFATELAAAYYAL